MDNPTLFKFVEETRQQSRFGQLAFATLRAAVNAMDVERAFAGAHALLHHAVVVSRLLWPDRAESAARGEALREALPSDPGGPLRLARWRELSSRPDEHFESWLGGLDQPNFVDFNLMPQAALGAFRVDQFQHNLDPDTFDFVYRGEACNLQKVANALQRLETVAQAWLRAHNPW